jgi:HlyD family secretion protein
MTAYVSIPVAQASDVLEVPNSALRFKPEMKPEEMRALLEKYGVQAQGEAGPATERASAAPAAGAGGAREGVAAGTRGGGKPAAGANVPPREPRHDYAVVWKLKGDGSLEPVAIRTGITDHTQTAVAQVLKGELQPGEELAIGMQALSKAPAGPGAGVRMR